MHFRVMCLGVTRVLFVCMGNICRSPAAEIVFSHLIEDAGLKGKIEHDSAGTIGYHQGNPPDPRMRTHLTAQGYRVFGTARPIRAKDLQDFDWILVMDEENERDVRKLDPQGIHAKKIRRFTDFCRHHSIDHVPDPYYGGDEGFTKVIDLVEDACAGWIEQHQPSSPSA